MYKSLRRHNFKNVNSIMQYTNSTMFTLEYFCRIILIRPSLLGLFALGLMLFGSTFPLLFTKHCGASVHFTSLPQLFSKFSQTFLLQSLEKD